MSYAITIGAAQIVPKEALSAPLTCSCSQAQRACMPAFVFSVPGQVNFRVALSHLLQCRTRTCASLRKKVRDGMKKKLTWLFEEESLLGCISVQPFLYRTHSVLNLDKRENFIFLIHHLSHCPHDSCSKLRRALLLTVRTNVSPNTRDRELVFD